MPRVCLQCAPILPLAPPAPGPTLLPAGGATTHVSHPRASHDATQGSISCALMPSRCFLLVVCSLYILPTSPAVQNPNSPPSLPPPSLPLLQNENYIPCIGVDPKSFGCCGKPEDGLERCGPNNWIHINETTTIRCANTPGNQQRYAHTHTHASKPSSLLLPLPIYPCLPCIATLHSSFLPFLPLSLPPPPAPSTSRPSGRPASFCPSKRPTAP